MATLTRRGFVLRAGAAAAGAAAAGTGLDRLLARSKAPAAVVLGVQPAGLPARQHAWTQTLLSDRYGNALAPRFDRLLFFDVNGRATPAHARVLEAALRALERAYEWGPSGLLFTVGWSPEYFQRSLGTASPIPAARALSNFELPAIDDYDVCIHLACDDAERLLAVEAALLGGSPPHGVAGALDISSALRWRQTRTGFVGAGLPAANQDVGGIPSGRPVPSGSPLFMGFRSGLRRNQASEDDVTIASGPFAGGTTMQVSYMRLRLDDWYGELDQRQRVALMYAPQISPQQVKDFTTDAPGDPAAIGEAITRYGAIGHSQSSAQARRNGKPLIIRRDFDTVDGGQAGLHFVSLQRSIEDFVKTREAMNVPGAQLRNPAVTETVNNGINAFIFVLNRANYLLPDRAMRSFPSLAGRERALA
jgi:hypothetical protein